MKFEFDWSYFTGCLLVVCFASGITIIATTAINASQAETEAKEAARCTQVMIGGMPGVQCKWNDKDEAGAVYVLSGTAEKGGAR